MKLGQRTFGENIWLLVPSISASALFSFAILALVLFCERALGLPVWFLVFSLYIVSSSEWPERAWWLVILAIMLAITYGLFFAVAVAILMIGAVGVIHTAHYVRSDTLRILLSTVVMIGALSIFLGSNWTVTFILLHTLSLGLAVALLRVAILRRGTLSQDGRRFFQSSLLLGGKTEV
jgi:hypothetical protein